MKEVETIVMQACHDVLKMKNPTLYEAVKGLVSRGIAPAGIDNYLLHRALFEGPSVTTPEQIEKANQEIRQRAQTLGMKFKESEILHVTDGGNELVFLRSHIVSKFDEGLGCDVETDEKLCYIQYSVPSFEFDWATGLLRTNVEQPKLKVSCPALFSKVDGDTQTFYDGEVVVHP